MYNKTSFINLTDYAELVGLCRIGPIMCKIMRAHNRIIPPSLFYGVWCHSTLRTNIWCVAGDESTGTVQVSVMLS